jgi:hypothetical protein
MAYFANGTESECYYAEYCAKCVHDQDAAKGHGCHVWLLHLLHNYEECNKPDSFLHVLIPRDKDGGNGPCSMFAPRDDLYPGCALCEAGLPIGRPGMHVTRAGGHAGPCLREPQPVPQTDPSLVAELRQAAGDYEPTSRMACLLTEAAAALDAE